MKKITVVLLVVSTLFFTQCEIYREGCMDPNASNYDVAADIDGGCEYNIDPEKIDCYTSTEGNLSISNETDDVLLLYQEINGESVFISCIPENYENFIVNIANQQSNIISLQVWKAIEVENSAKPNLISVYRQWSVPLSSTSNLDERANWIITDSDVNSSSGTLLLSYPLLDEYNQEVIYQVDIYLNSKTGTRLASLQPGANEKQVSVDYGIRNLYFRYWYSDPNSTNSSIKEIGWSEIEDIVINAEHRSSKINIPVFYSAIGKYGSLRVYNKTDNAIAIYANDQLIENIASVDGSPNGLSIIPANNSTTFLIPEKSYLISAKSVDGATTINSFKGVNIIPSETTELYAGVKNKEVSITNSTSEQLIVFSEDGKYLGKEIDAGSSSGSFIVQEIYDSILVITPDKTKKKKIAATTGVVVTELEEYVTQDLSITTSWTNMGIGYYESPDINDKETTTMTATLLNSSTVLLSFEYKVSSEYNYDNFNFTIDGNSEISNESGESDWKYFSINVSPGNHSLQWIYSKDDMFTVGLDKVELRNISIQ